MNEMEFWLPGVSETLDCLLTENDSNIGNKENDFKTTNQTIFVEEL